MIKQLIRLANHLDKKGFTKEADYLDAVIRRMAGPKSWIDLDRASEQAKHTAEVPDDAGKLLRDNLYSLMPIAGQAYTIREVLESLSELLIEYAQANPDKEKIKDLQSKLLADGTLGILSAIPLFKGLGLVKKLPLPSNLSPAAKKTLRMLEEGISISHLPPKYQREFKKIMKHLAESGAGSDL